MSPSVPVVGIAQLFGDVAHVIVRNNTHSLYNKLTSTHPRENCEVLAVDMISFWAIVERPHA